MPTPPRTARARAARRHRLAALGAVALASLAMGMVAGSGHKSSSEKRAARFAAAWQRGDYRGMYALLTPASRQRYPIAAFTAAYTRARGMSTAERLVAGRPADPGGRPVPGPVSRRTR